MLFIILIKRRLICNGINFCYVELLSIEKCYNLVICYWSGTQDHLENRGSDRKTDRCYSSKSAAGTGFLFTPRGTRRERVQIKAKPCFVFIVTEKQVIRADPFLSSTLFWRFCIGGNGDFWRKKNHSNLNSVARQRND